MANKYPVEWRGQTYYLGDITVGVKKEFCQWLRKKLKAEAVEDLAGDVRDQHLAGVSALVWWADAGCSVTVHQYLKTPDGGLYINRLLFGDSAKVLSDADLAALVTEKEADPTSDYMVAMHSIREDADPKARS